MEKKLAILTTFGPVPYEAVKDYLPKKVVEEIELNKERIIKAFSTSNGALDEDYYITKLADSKGWEFRKMKSYIDNLTKLNPASAAVILLREIAIDFDEKYEGHINDSDEIWTISLLSGKVEQVDKTKVKNYRNFPAFRNKKDAVKAHAILSKRIRKMFRGGAE